MPEVSPVKTSLQDSEPPEPDRGEITRWLIAGTGGDAHALESLLPLVYEELHRQAVRFFRRERADHTLQPTALVNEVYLRLINQNEVSWRNRAQFFGIAAQMMRRILVNYALARGAGKRGGAVQRVSLEDAMIASPEREGQILDLDEALEKLAGFDPRKARIVELRFFAGLSVEETAAVLKVSPQTVLRDWGLAKSWLAREINIPSSA